MYQQEGKQEVSACYPCTGTLEPQSASDRVLMEAIHHPPPYLRRLLDLLSMTNRSLHIKRTEALYTERDRPCGSCPDPSPKACW